MVLIWNVIFILLFFNKILKATFTKVKFILMNFTVNFFNPDKIGQTGSMLLYCVSTAQKLNLSLVLAIDSLETVWGTIMLHTSKHLTTSKVSTG